MEAEIKTKVCNCCGRELPISAFNKNSTYSDGYKSWCRECEIKKWKKNEWMNHNLALEYWPWPFNEDHHEMDFEAIKESILQKNPNFKFE